MKRDELGIVADDFLQRRVLDKQRGARQLAGVREPEALAEGDEVVDVERAVLAEELPVVADGVEEAAVADSQYTSEK